MDELWNGKFFIKHFEPKTGRKVPNSFIAQLAGDWLARLSGTERTLAPDVTDSAVREIIARHVKPFYPAPPMEVTPDGGLATAACYIIQHEPYAGCEAINEGYTDDGLDVIKRVFDCAWTLNRSPWHQSLAYNAPSGEQGGLVSYMTCPATWHVLNALSGSTVDVSARTLFISPRIAKTLPELHMPLFFSRFWLWIDYAPSARKLSLRVLKTFGDPVTIDSVAAEGGAEPIVLPAPFTVRKGAVLDLSGFIGKLVLFARPKTVDYSVRAHLPPRPGISADGWQAQAVRGDEPEFVFPAGAAFDGDPATRWTTGRPMKPGDRLTIDFGRARTVHKVVLDSSSSPGDYPRGCTVAVSLDGKTWKTAARLTQSECDSRQKKGVIEIELSGASARYLRITQDGNHDGLFWTVHEVYVYE